MSRVEVAAEITVYVKDVTVAAAFLADLSRLATKYDADAIVKADPKSVDGMEGL